MLGRASHALALVVFATLAAAVQAQTKPDALGNTPATRAPSLNPSADAAPKSPAEIEADTLGPPVKTKTFRVGPDGKAK